MTTSPAYQASPVLDAEALYRELLRGVRSMLTPPRALAGIASGGAGWPSACKRPGPGRPCRCCHR